MMGSDSGSGSGVLGLGVEFDLWDLKPVISY